MPDENQSPKNEEEKLVPTKPGKKVEIPKVDVQPIADVVSPPPPSDDKFTGGLFTKISDGQPYVLAIHEPDTYRRTHTAKNSANFWQGTAKEFRDQFDPAK